MAQQGQLLAYRCLVDGEGLLSLAGRFVHLSSTWLLHTAAGGQLRPPADGGEEAGVEPEAVYAKLPEHAAVDPCRFLKHMAAQPPPLSLRSCPWAQPLVSRFVCGLLGRRELLSSPFVRMQLVDALYVLASYDEYQQKHSRGLGSQLFDLVDGRGAEEVQPPLLALYVELGLHTNADAVTDKNSQRFLLMKVLRRLWQQPSGWNAFVKIASEETATAATPAAAAAASSSSAAAAASSAGGGGASSSSFGEFATTLVKENIFLLDDALGRLADVKKREGERADEAAWQAQPKKVRDDRERRLESVRRTAKSFLDLGKVSLSALLLLLSEPHVAAAFTEAPRQSRTQCTAPRAFRALSVHTCTTQAAAPRGCCRPPTAPPRWPTCSSSSSAGSAGPSARRST